MFVLAVFAVMWIIGNHHVADVMIEANTFMRLLKDATLAGAILWITYVALEPYARRFWPELMLGWSRLLAGHLRDARVGRDVIIGVSFGVLWLLLDMARFVAPQMLGFPAMRPRLGSALDSVLGVSWTAQVWLTQTIEQLMKVLTLAFLFIALRWLTRRTWLAIPLAMYGIYKYWSAFGPATAFWVEWTLEVAIVGLFTLVLIRFGLLAAVVASIIAGIGRAVPLTLDVAHWSATPSNWTLGAILALALFGAYASRGRLRYPIGLDASRPPVDKGYRTVSRPA